VSTTDPDETYFSKGDKAPTFGYFDNYLMDNASCIIGGVEATDARPSGEIASAREMVADLLLLPATQRQWLVAALSCSGFFSSARTASFTSASPRRAASAFLLSSKSRWRVNT